MTQQLCLLMHPQLEPEFANFLDDRPDEGPDLSCVCDEYTGLHLWEGSRTSAIKTLQNELFRYDSLHSLGQIIETVPSKEICDSLWAAFIATIYPLIPILHLPTFYQQYDDFWACLASYQTKGPPEGLLAECPTFLVLLLSILFCGSLHCYLTQSEPDGQAKSSTEEQKQQSQSLYRATIQALTLLSFPRDPTIYSLAAFVILHVPLIREESERSSTFISTAFRVGQALGLHRDPKHFNATDIEAEIRRRLWWHILHKDTLSSSATGLPQMMWSQKQHDTALISECRDDNLRGVQTFGTPVSGLSNEDSNGILKDSSLRESTQITSLGCVDYSALRDDEVDCRQVVSAGRFLITNTLRDILERHTEPKPWSIQEVYTFERLIERTKIQVQGRMDRLQDPNTLDALNDVILADTDINQHSLPPREASIESWTLVPTSQNRVFLHWARKVLGLMLEKAYCTLYQPLEACSDQAVWQRFRER
ncbi:MAG: hypothetical protein M1821_003928 [Bathelium mastoideum]|nr:MAG: hypothetical protein M1821_003928 [Bathelium mastoideum]